MRLIDWCKQERGRQSQLASAIKAHAPDVSDWANEIRPVPIERCWPIEQATEGAVTRKDLRPDDWERIWPELANPTDPKRRAADKAEA